MCMLDVLKSTFSDTSVCAINSAQFFYNSNFIPLRRLDFFLSNHFFGFGTMVQRYMVYFFCANCTINFHSYTSNTGPRNCYSCCQYINPHRVVSVTENVLQNCKSANFYRIWKKIGKSYKMHWCMHLWMVSQYIHRWWIETTK